MGGYLPAAGPACTDWVQSAVKAACSPRIADGRVCCCLPLALGTETSCRLIR
jgi:hypothetical protein